MFIKNIQIKNFRCFSDQTINFNTPDNSNLGSGLNILIGDNGNGKTSVLEALELLTQSRLKTKGTLSVFDFKNINDEITIVAETDHEFEVKRLYGSSKFKANGFTFWAKTRSQNSNDLVDPFVFDNVVNQSCATKIQEVEVRLEVQTPYGGRFPKFQLVFFDKRRARHISKGTYPAKFDEIIDDLNFQIVKAINSLDESDPIQKEKKENLLGINKNAKDVVNSVLTDKLLERILDGCKDFFEDEISLDLLNKLEPFANAYFSISKRDSVHQLPISSLGSGIEMIFSIIFLYKYYSRKEEPLILLIDEPEMHLHPTWQHKLVDLLMTISKDNQVFISTHSPYIFKNCINKNTNLLIFNRENEEVQISYANSKSWGKFPWSPSWGEINYFAYNLVTIEFLNELYGYFQEKNNTFPEKDVEDLLENKGIPKNKSYTKVKPDGTTITYNVTLCTYVRHQIHHPENSNNIKYTEQELRTSIENLLSNL